MNAAEVGEGDTYLFHVGGLVLERPFHEQPRGPSTSDQEEVDFRTEGSIRLKMGGQIGRRRTGVDRTRFGVW